MIRSSVLLIVVDASTSDGRRASPNRGPPTVAPAAEPTTTRKVGASTPPRLPSAFAEPPAPGTLALRSNPDPSVRGSAQ